MAEEGKIDTVRVGELARELLYYPISLKKV
jgi:hypothetical protein